MDNTTCGKVSLDALNDMFEMNPKLKKIDAYDFGDANKEIGFKLVDLIAKGIAA